MDEKDLNERVKDAAERLVAEGKFPAWMERLSYDTAKVLLGGADEFVVVASPPKSASAQLQKAQSELTRIAQIAQRPDDATKAEDLGKAMERLTEIATSAEVAFFTAAILEVGPGVVFRTDVSEWRAGDPIPIPRTVRDLAERRLLITDGFPEFVLTRVRDAVGFLATQGVSAFLGNG